MNTSVEALANWHEFVNEKDEQTLAEALAENVVFHSPFIWRPKEGKAVTMLYLKCAVRVLENFTYHRQVVGDNTAVLEFSARVGQLSVKGVDILHFNAAGQITDVEVMVRPANGLQALGAAMAQALAAAGLPQS